MKADASQRHRIREWSRLVPPVLKLIRFAVSSTSDSVSWSNRNAGQEVLK
jgi:hypothetical protein